MREQNKAKNSKSKPSAARKKSSTPKKIARDKVGTQLPWGNLIGNGAEIAASARESISQSLAAVSAETLTYSNQAFEQTVVAVNAVADARSLDDLVNAQTRCLTEAWHQTFDYWTNLSESVTKTTPKGLLRS
jgi:hypothetical protein